MENMTTQVGTPLLHRYEAAAFGSGSTATTATANPFDAIIAAMVEQMMEDNPGETAESLLTQTFGNSQKNDALLSANSAMMNVLPSNMLSLLMANTLSPTGELPQEALLSALSGSQTSLLNEPLNGSTLSQNLQSFSMLTNEGSSTASALLSGIPVTEASYSTGSEKNFSDLMGFQQNFRQTILNVKQQLKQNSDETAVTPLSVDQLQSSARLTNVQELMAQKTEASSEVPLTDQLTQGIREHLSLGDSEFTLKLKPESLGEISIKLVKAGGKLTLDIVAASSQTARLINSDLSALQQAVKPMQVEVHEAMTSHAGQNDAQQYNMAGQQFSGSGQQDSFHRSSTPYYAAAEEGYGKENDEPEPAVDPSSQLSVYI